MYIRKIFLNKNVTLLFFLKTLLCPLPQNLRCVGWGVGLTGHVSLAAHSPAVPRGQDHFPEGRGAPHPAARRLLRGPPPQPNCSPAQVPGLQRACSKEDQQAECQTRPRHLPLSLCLLPCCCPSATEAGMLTYLGCHIVPVSLS